MTRTGKEVIALLGSGEFLPWAATVDRSLLDRARIGDGRVLILPTASAPEGTEVFDGWGRRGVEHYERLGIAAAVAPLRTREDAADPAVVAMLSEVSMLFLSGGNPAYLAEVLRDSPFWAVAVDRIARGMAFAGCSAGAACLPEVAPDTSVASFGPEFWRPGLGYVRGALLAPHWDVLDRDVPGLTRVIEEAVPPGGRLVGLDEQTAMLGDGTRWTVLGAGGIHLIAGEHRSTHRAGDAVEVALMDGKR
jgi:cyanophycinase-like exopeptidase